MEKYQIASVLEAREEHEGVLVNINVIGASKIFRKNIKEIYTKEWLKKFSHEDVAYIGFLAAAEYNGNRQLIKSFPKKKRAVTNNVVFLGVVVQT